MPDRRTHRGPHPEDDRLFAAEVHRRLRDAASDLSWLLSRGYPSESSLKLIGDRYSLLARQRIAVGRAACGDQQARRRAEHAVPAEGLAGRAIWVDGYNVLTTVEAALGGGVILVCRDGTYRDMASMHGSYRKVAETWPALGLIGRTLAELGAGGGRWLLDRPVSNSGRLKVLIEEAAAANGWAWEVELVPDPDPLLAGTDQIVATSDSGILDQCRQWLNLARRVVERHVAEADLVRLDMPFDRGE